ncbi:MAG: hypothetical protein IPK16_15370 [Anaerolineales bacterium]|nr:hypothetical protein [Anaerolineales bacterium]
MMQRDGVPPAPSQPSGAFRSSASQTTFPDDLPIASVRMVAYQVSRQRIAGIPLARLILFLLGAFAMLGLMAPPPGRWMIPLVSLLLIVAFLSAMGALRRQSYVRFVERSLSPYPPQALAQPAKVPIYASGLLGVQGRQRHFAGAPGFYRTFPTREHAVMCQVRPRRWLTIAGWPEDEVGLWYTFFRPEECNAIRAGVIHFDRLERPALAIDYRTQPLPDARGRQRKAEPRVLYLAFLTEADRATVLSDLAVDSPALAPITASH